MEPNLITIKTEVFHGILEQLESSVRLMGYGREVQKIRNIVKQLPLENIDLSKYYYIKRTWENR